MWMLVARNSRARCALLAVLSVLTVSVGGVARAGPSAEVADAAMRGDSDQLLSLLEHGADVNAAQGDGMFRDFPGSP